MPIILKKKIFLCASILLLSISVSNLSCSASLNKRIIGKQRYNQIRASEALKSIRSGQSKYRAEKGEYGSIKALAASNLISDTIVNDVYEGYKISAIISASSYKVIAIPVEYKVTGIHSFYLDESGIIRISSVGNREPNSSDPAIVDQ
jgi:hypothetical protein